MIRTRFAPSPTGEIHIGNLRTVIFNWIFARKMGGKMFLRIEDTHEDRCLPAHEELIFKMLRWLDLDFDDCFDEVLLKNGFKPTGKSYLKQSDYKETYIAYAKEIYQKGMAYYCICESIDVRCWECRNSSHTKGVLRFKTPENIELAHGDMVFGYQHCNSNNVEDFALLRSNNDPTYMICVVVDDHLMEISHVIRGEDHRTNTFKQILIYKAMGWDIPKFAHLPMVKDELGKKISKRNRDSNSEIYKNEGVVPQALFNILLRLGWGYKNEEIISRQRILEIFDISQVRKSPTMFDKKKLYSFSATYLRQNDYSKEAVKFLKEIEPNMNPSQEESIKKLYPEIVKRVSTFGEMYDYVKFLFHWQKEGELPEDIINEIQAIDPWNYESLMKLLKYRKEILAQLRRGLVNSDISVDIMKIMEVIGKDEVLRRLK